MGHKPASRGQNDQQLMVGAKNPYKVALMDDLAPSIERQCLTFTDFCDMIV